MLVLPALAIVPSTTAQESAQVQIWVQGSPIHGANGLNFGPDGNLYIASVWGLEIVVMNPDTGEIVDRIGPDEGGGGADDLAFGPDGSLYWTSIFTGEVVRRAPDGNVTRQIVAPSMNPITFSDDGPLFVAKSIVQNDGLYELDPNLVEPPRLRAEQGVNGMDWGSDGFLYGPIPFEGRIVRIDITTDPASFETFVETTLPTAVKFSPQGDLYATTGLGQLHKSMLRQRPANWSPSCLPAWTTWPSTPQGVCLCRATRTVLSPKSWPMEPPARLVPAG